MNKPNFNTLKNDLLKLALGKGIHAQIDEMNQICRDYAQQSQSLRIINEIQIACSNVAFMYSDQDGTAESYTADFGKLETLLDEAETRIAMLEVGDILFDNFIKRNPDVDFD